MRADAKVATSVYAYGGRPIDPDRSRYFLLCVLRRGKV